MSKECGINPVYHLSYHPEDQMEYLYQRNTHMICRFKSARMVLQALDTDVSSAVKEAGTGVRDAMRTLNDAEQVYLAASRAEIGKVSEKIKAGKQVLKTLKNNLPFPYNDCPSQNEWNGEFPTKDFTTRD